jgi:hypothetical protein
VLEKLEIEIDLPLLFEANRHKALKNSTLNECTNQDLAVRRVKT